MMYSTLDLQHVYMLNNKWSLEVGVPALATSRASPKDVALQCTLAAL